jgi:exodeoxyribonuclease VII large subunit
MVANISLKTPTAVADFLIEKISLAENRLFEISTEIKNFSHTIIENNRTRIETSAIKLIPLARIMMNEIKDKLSEKIIDIINVGKEYTFKAGLIPANQASKLNSAVKSFLSGKKTFVERTSQNFINSTFNFLTRNNTRLDGLDNSLNILNPDNVLKRGYTITSLNGRIIKRSELLKIEDLIDTQFSDGNISSRITDKN